MKEKWLLSVLFLFILPFFLMHAQDSVDCSFTNGTWVLKAPMPEARAFMASGIINGKIYSTCGVIQGVDDFILSTTLNVYDPLTDTWDTTGAPIPYPRYIGDAGPSVVDGKMYVVGGLEWEMTADGWVATPLARMDVYDPQTDSWDLKANLPEPKGGKGICTLDGKIYITGGFSGQPETGGEFNKSVYVYDPVTDTWTAKSDMLAERAYHVSLAYDGKIYVFGGNDQDHRDFAVNTAEVYDPATDEWTQISPMLFGRSDYGGCVMDNGIFLFGGIGGGDGGLPHNYSIQKYNPETDQWFDYGLMPEAFYDQVVCAIGGKIYIFGGLLYGGGVLKGKVYEFKPSDVVLDESIPDAVLEVDATLEIDLSQHFSHVDGEEITYTACIRREGTIIFTGNVSDSLNGHLLILKGLKTGEVEVSILAESGSDQWGDKFVVDVTPPVGISGRNASSELLQIFPNPAEESITIQRLKEGIHDYKIFSVNGQVLDSGILTESSNTIDVSFLEQGMYFLRVSMQDHFVTRKFIKR